MRTVQERIKLARVRAGLTQLELGKRINMSGAAIAYIESGKRKLTVEHVICIAEATNHPISYFFEGRSKPVETALEQLTGKLGVLTKLLDDKEQDFDTEQERKEMLFEAFKASSESMFILRDDFSVRYSNPAANTLLEFKHLSDQQIRNYFVSYTQTEECDVCEMMHQLNKQGQWYGTLTMLTATNEPILTRFSAKQFQTKNTDVTGYLIMFHKERQVEQYHQFFEKIFHMKGMPLYRSSSDGVFTYVNQPYLDMLGYEKHELLGKHFLPLIYEPNLEKMQQVTKRLEQEGEVKDSLLIKKKNGDVIAINFYVQLAGDGSRIGYVVSDALVPNDALYRNNSK